MNFLLAPGHVCLNCEAFHSILIHSAFWSFCVSVILCLFKLGIQFLDPSPCPFLVGRLGLAGGWSRKNLSSRAAQLVSPLAMGSPQVPPQERYFFHVKHSHPEISLYPTEWTPKTQEEARIAVPHFSFRGISIQRKLYRRPRPATQKHCSHLFVFVQIRNDVMESRIEYVSWCREFIPGKRPLTVKWIRLHFCFCKIVRACAQKNL